MSMGVRYERQRGENRRRGGDAGDVGLRAPACSSAAGIGVKPLADVALTAAQGLHDHTDELAQIAQMPLEERAAALAAIHEDLASVLHKAEG